MASDDRDDTKASSDSSQEKEQNPFIAFRHQVDRQVNSILSSVFNLPSTIYNQGAQHGREWSQQHSYRSSDDAAAKDKANCAETSKDWEQAMKDFEDSEREAKEWYDTVLKQITARRDRHLESGLGYEGKEAKGNGASVEEPMEELSCPYLPPKEQRVSQPAQESWNCRGRRWCGREHPHSRFLDWVWTGWGGPSTTPNMLWQQDRAERAPEYQKESTETQMSEERLPEAPPASDELEEMLEKELGFPVENPITFASWLSTSSYSPLQLDEDPETRLNPFWRVAYEDLVRAEMDEPLTEEMEFANAVSAHPLVWTGRIMELHFIKGMDEEARKNYKAIRTLVPRFFDDSQPLRELVAEMGPPAQGLTWDELMGAVFGHERDDDEQTELAAYMRGHDNIPSQPFHARAGFVPSEPEASKPSILSTLTRTERIVNPDGTVTEKTVLKERFGNGRERTTETTKTTDQDGLTKSESSSTTDAPDSSTGDFHSRSVMAPRGPQVYIFEARPACPWPSRESSTPGERKRVEAADTGNENEQGERKSAGWFWRS